MNSETGFTHDKPALHFPQGLYGFEEYKDFTLSDSEYRPFMWLQSVSEKALTFLVVDPFLFFPDYELDVDDESMEDIEVKNASDVLIIAIVTLTKNGKPSITANLQGPIVINRNNKQAKQIVLQDPRWRTKHDLTQLSVNPNTRSPSC